MLKILSKPSVRFVEERKMSLSIFGESSTLFAGKRAVISGGSTGIGRATAIQLARWGADVLIFGRHERELADAMTHLRLLGGRSIAVRADQALLADVSRVFDTVDAEFGQIDFMINNAADPVHFVPAADRRADRLLDTGKPHGVLDAARTKRSGACAKAVTS